MNIEHLFLRGFILNMRPAQITSIDKIFLTRGEMNNPKKQLKSWPVQPLTPNPVPMSARMDSHAQLDPSTTVRAEVSYNHLEFDARLHKRKVSHKLPWILVTKRAMTRRVCLALKAGRWFCYPSWTPTIEFTICIKTLTIVDRSDSHSIYSVFNN